MKNRGDIKGALRPCRQHGKMLGQSGRLYVSGISRNPGHRPTSAPHETKFDRRNGDRNAPKLDRTARQTPPSARFQAPKREVGVNHRANLKARQEPPTPLVSLEAVAALWWSALDAAETALDAASAALTAKELRSSAPGSQTSGLRRQRFSRRSPGPRA